MLCRAFSLYKLYWRAAVQVGQPSDQHIDVSIEIIMFTDKGRRYLKFWSDIRYLFTTGIEIQRYNPWW